MKKNIKTGLLGCIADDFTGASDAASFLQKAGLKVVLFNETPQDDIDLSSYDAAVIALKTRTMPVADAVAQSMGAVKWLKNNGAEYFYSKYCSTFDSTSAGNIGPIADAVMEYLDVSYTLLCPALPVNGRVVKDGLLYVNGELLSDSPMKHHPLTPMHDSSIKRLMEAQSKYPAYPIGKNLSNQKEQGKEQHYYLIPDYENDEDARNIVKEFGELRFLTGGSGLLQFWGAYLLGKTNRTYHARGIVLAGSCSKATLEQITVYREAGHAAFRIIPEKLLEEAAHADRKGAVLTEILEFVAAHQQDYVLIYSSDTAENVKKTQQSGKEQIAELIEQTLSETARVLVEKGYYNVIVAGGETSGAVTKKLGFSAFEIGESVAPGVPVMTPTGHKKIHLVLKSGNFGQPDFFERAVRAVEECHE